MLNFKFDYLSAQNFMCFGPEGIELDLSSYGNIVLIRGDNLDVVDEGEKLASNAVGKSSISAIIIYTIYGKTIKSEVSQENLIHNKIGKGLKTEVRFNDFKIVRTRKPNTLRVWEDKNKVWGDNTEITLGTIPTTQALIEQRIGISYNTFKNVIVFTDNSKDCFLECDSPSKRHIVDNLLSLSQYRQYSDSAKKIKNDYRDKLKNMGDVYQRMLTVLQSCQDRLHKTVSQQEAWIKQKTDELESTTRAVKDRQAKLKTTHTGEALSQYNNAQEQIKLLTEQIPQVQLKLDKIKLIENDARKKTDELNKSQNNTIKELRTLEIETNTNKQEVYKYKGDFDSYSSQEDGKVCRTCFGKIDKNNIEQAKEHCQHEITRLNKIISSKEPLITELKTKIDVINNGIKKCNSAIALANIKDKEIRQEIVNIQRSINEFSKIRRPETGTEEKIISDQIEQLKKQEEALKTEISKPPYSEIIKSTTEEVLNKKTECENHKKELETAENELPYYDFWVKAFGDTGIRKYIIDGILPALNSKISYWLQYLIDGKIKLEFDNELQEKIERNPADGDPFVYHAMSGGERRRLNLAVSQAFAYVMTISSGVSPSLVFLDEVSTNIDQIGNVGVYNMIVQLSKEKQTFITTHDKDLLQMLDGCQRINLKKQNGFTVLVP